MNGIESLIKKENKDFYIQELKLIKNLNKRWKSHLR